MLPTVQVKYRDQKPSTVDSQIFETVYDMDTCIRLTHCVRNTGEKQSYECTYCKSSLHIKKAWSSFHTGNKAIVPARDLLPGAYCVYNCPTSVFKGNTTFEWYHLDHPPSELYPASSKSKLKIPILLFLNLVQSMNMKWR